MPTVEQANSHRAEIAALSTLASRQLTGWWAELRELDTAEAVREALRDLLPQLVRFYSTASAAVAADWYDEIREGDGVRGRFTAMPAEPEELGTDELAGWAVDPLFQAEPDWDRTAVLVEGGVQLRIANAARDTITGSALEDPAATGWQRVGDGGCAFCQMLIGRGAVYTKAGATFGAHENCGCAAVPAWGGQPVPVKAYVPTSRTITDADRARVRAWIKANT